MTKLTFNDFESIVVSIGDEVRQVICDRLENKLISQQDAVSVVQGVLGFLYTQHIVALFSDGDAKTAQRHTINLMGLMAKNLEQMLGDGGAS